MTVIKNFFKVILYKPLFNLLIFIVWLVPNDNVGWAIVILTILIRLALYPSQRNAIDSQKKLQELQPQMDEIKQKYGKDQQGQAQAMMDLYKQNKVNPFSSCLPLLIQLPILIILYKVFTVGLNTDRYGDLLYSFTPHPETINTMFYGLDLNTPSLALAIVAGVLQFIQSWQMLKAQPKKTAIVKQGEKSPESMMGDFSKQMTYIFPVFTVFIAMKLPSALAIYWIVTTLFMIAQQYIVYHPNRRNKDTKGVSVKVTKPSN